MLNYWCQVSSRLDSSFDFCLVVGRPLLVYQRRIFFLLIAKAFWNHQPGWWFSLYKEKTCKKTNFLQVLAEAVRFELTVGLTPSLVFKTSSINHSDKPPYFWQFSIFLEKSLELRCRRKRHYSKVLLPQGLFALEVPISSQDFKTGP